jgi:hypothetical protein
MIDPAVIDALLAAGATAEMIAAAHRADHAVEEAKVIARRRRDADRKRDSRASAMSRGQPVTPRDSADASPSPPSPPSMVSPITPSLTTPSSTPSSAEARKRASRLPSDWKPSEENLEYARMRGLSAHEIDVQAEKFRNYWTAKSGQQATKIDWNRTWQNWIIDTSEKLGRLPLEAGTGPPAGLTPEQIEDWKGGWRPGMPSSAELLRKGPNGANH